MCTILIVEDEEILRFLLEAILLDNGFKVISAVDGIDAVEKFIANKDEIKIVLSDLGLPRLGGWEAFLQMKKINPNVKGVMASGFFDPKVREEIIKTGANDFIEKPYNTKTIGEMLKRLCQEK